MVALAFFTLVVVAVPGTVLTWHLIFRLEANKENDTRSQPPERGSSKKGETFRRYRAANGKVGEDGESFDIL